jgi:large subunit ribosomal protein L20
LFKSVKGQFGGRSKLLRTARQSLRRKLNSAYKDRRRKKREFRRLWIQRINAAARMRGLTYSRFINGLTRARVGVDRKQLSHIAVSDPATFDQLVVMAREALQRGAA